MTLTEGDIKLIANRYYDCGFSAIGDEEFETGGHQRFEYTEEGEYGFRLISMPHIDARDRVRINEAMRKLRRLEEEAYEQDRLREAAEASAWMQ